MHRWINPYFDPNPQLYPLISKFLGCIGIWITIFTLYCMCTKSPKSVTPFYKGLLIYSQITFLVAQAVLSIGMIPIIMLPYGAAYSLGFFTTWNIPATYQCVALIWSIISCGSSMIALFFHKMDVLIPIGHRLHRIVNFFRIPIYFIVFVAYHIGTPLCWIVYFSATNQAADKLAVAEELGIFSEKLFENGTVIITIPQNLGLVHVAVIILCALVLFGSILTIVVSATVSLKVLHDKRISMSKKTREMHKAWLTSHILQFLACIGISIAIFTLYCIVAKSPREVTPFYKGLLIYSQISFLLSQAMTSLGMAPVIMLPYSAFYSFGLFATLDIPPAYHLTAFAWLCVFCGSSMVSLFFYKMDALIPQGHFLRKTVNSFRIVVYFLAFIFCHIFTPIAWAFYFLSTNQYSAKLAIAEDLGIFSEKLFEDTTLVMTVIRPTSWVHYAGLGLCCFALILLVLATALLATVSLMILHNKRSSMSEKTREMHKAWIIGHILQILVVLILLGGPLIALVVACSTKWNRADLANIGAIIYSQASPICSIIVLFSSRTYKRYLFKLIGIKNAPQRKNTTVFVEIGK